MQTATIVAIDDLPLMLHPYHVQTLTGLSMVTIYKVLRQPGCPVVHFGKSIRVLRDPFFRWMEERAGWKPPGLLDSAGDAR